MSPPLKPRFWGGCECGRERTEDPLQRLSCLAFRIQDPGLEGLPSNGWLLGLQGNVRSFKDPEAAQVS